MNLFTALGISVAAGFLVVAFSFLGQILWKWVLENWYLRITCRHLADIGGRWTWEERDEAGWLFSEVFELKQYGYKIVGVSHFEAKPPAGSSEGASDSDFEVTGILRNDLFSAHYHNKDRRRKGSGSFTLKVTGSGLV